jgi:HEAT repeat protein
LLEDALNILKAKNQAPDRRLDAVLYIVDKFELECLPIFEDILNDTSEHPDVRSAVALGLAKMGGDKAMEILVAHATSEDITVKNYVIQALGRLGREEVIPILIDSLKDKSNYIFASAAEALGKIGKPVVPYLIQLLSEGADDARCVAAWQLGELRYTDAVPALIQSIKSDPNTELVALAIWAVGEIGYGPPEALETLLWAKAQTNPDIHLRAELAIKKIARHAN